MWHPGSWVIPVVHRTYPYQVALQQSLLPFQPDAQVYTAISSVRFTYGVPLSITA
jgi:hypothetical protein